MTPGDDRTPSFVWDPALLRVTWANRAGLALWGAGGVGELRRRAFAPRDATAAALNDAFVAFHAASVGEHRTPRVDGSHDGWIDFAPPGGAFAGPIAGRIGPEGRLHVTLLDEAAEEAHADGSPVDAAFDATPVGLAIVAPDGAILRRNAADGRLFPAPGDFPARFRDPDAARRALRAAERDGGWTHQAELLALGAFRPFQIEYRALGGPDAAVLCRAEPAFPEAARDARREIAAAAHDLRSPLTAIHGYAELLERDGGAMEADRRADCLAQIRAACAAMLGAVEALTEGAGAGDAEVFNPSEIADAVARLHAPRVRTAGRELSLVVDRPALARGEALATRRIVDNLIDNAIRHGGGRIEVIVAGTSVTVSDEGGGAQDPTGSGLGLANCRSLAAEIGASLTVRTPPDGGCSASLRLSPAAAEEV